jgi:ATP-binding cassette subfamily C (CFTR/MRP) protein 4
MRKTNGEIHCKGKIFYVPQVPWIFPGSLRQNILFGKEYNEEKYLRVINACGLNFETERLEENTQISENSVSGGQRARINMARALYSEADLFLFDDSFSSLDEQTANHLIENCINGYLESKIRILVTHQHRYLEKAKQIIELNDGEISFKGNYSDFQKKHHLEFEKNLDTDSSEKIGFTGKLKSTMNKLIIRKENQKKVESKKVKESKNKQSKSFSLRTYLRYFKGNEILFFFVISIFIFTQNMVYFCDYFSLKWASFEKNHEFDSTVSFNLTNNIQTSFSLASNASCN